MRSLICQSYPRFPALSHVQEDLSQGHCVRGTETGIVGSLLELHFPSAGVKLLRATNNVLVRHDACLRTEEWHFRRLETLSIKLILTETH
jgi:hypothetical protein